MTGSIKTDITIKNDITGYLKHILIYIENCVIKWKKCAISHILWQ